MLHNVKHAFHCRPQMSLTPVSQPPVARSCPGCAASSDTSHRFCPQCGTRLDQAIANLSQAPAASNDASRFDLRLQDSIQPDPMAYAIERKQVTVLFADLCDSTSYVNEADPEEARAILDAALRIMIDAVQAYGGTVSQLLGDGLLALFGAPISLEDHALRACLAGSTMLAGSRSNPPLNQNQPFSFRIGIHSGEVIAGVAGEQSWAHYRADGSTIHLASRIEKVSAPGCITMSAATVRLLDDSLDTQPIGQHIIRGFDQPVDLFQLVTGSGLSAAAPMARRHKMAPLVGREDAVHLLNQAAVQARQGMLRVVGLRGEAGVGKSRLITEWTASEVVVGFSICTTQARSYSRGNAYGFVTDLAQGLLALLGGAAALGRLEPGTANDAATVPVASDPRDVVRELLHLSGSQSVWQVLSSPARQQRVAEALRWLLDQCIAQGPLLLIFEDLFLSDPESHRVLEDLLPFFVDAPMMVGISYRPDFAHLWADSPWFIEHWIAPLPEAQMRSIAQALLGEDESVAELVGSMVDRADGNPFFFEQMVLTLIAEGGLHGTPGSYRLARPVSELRVPASIASVVSSRVDRLPAAAKSVMEAAAVLVEPLNWNLLGSMVDASQEQVTSLLRQCMSAGLLSALPVQAAAAGVGSFRFRHSLVQEVVQGNLSRPRRKELHRRAYSALNERLQDVTGDRSPVLTRHAFNGELWEQAVSQALRSMAWAVSRSANREALRLFDLGLEAARRMPGPAQAKALELNLLLESIAALMALGMMDAIFDNLERAETIAEELSDQRRRASILLQTSVFLWMRGRYTQGLTVATEAGEAGRLAERRNLQLSAAQSIIMMFHGLGQYGTAAGEAKRVLIEYSAELQQHRLMAGWATVPAVNLYSFLGSSLWRLGEVEAAQAMLDRAYQILAGFDHPYSRGLIDFVQGQLWVETGQVEPAVELMRNSVKLCEIHDIPTLLPCCVAILGAALARGGHVAEAVDLLGSAVRDRVYLPAGTYGEFFLVLNLGTALRISGSLRQAVESGEKAVELAESGEQYGHSAEAHYELALSLSQAGYRQRAVAIARHGLQRAEECAMPYLAGRLENLVSSIGVRGN